MSNPIAAALKATGFVQVWKEHGSDLNFTLYCRIKEDDNARWAQLAERVLRAELAANEKGDEMFRLMLARRWMIVRGNFGYTWQVSVWARDVGSLDEAAALFRPGPAVRRAPIELGEAPLPHRSSSRNDPSGKLVRGARGKMVPSERGAYGTPVD
tara:strand:+ start:297 stop:761 length:465 start_codon:yes stop_codon:yes gene_type:complete